MTTPPSLYHAFLRPSILQILRATGYHSTRPAVLDSITDLAARYLSLLCEATAGHAMHTKGEHAAADFDVADVRMALQDVGAMLPEKLVTEQEWQDNEDLRGVEEFVRWFAGQRMKQIMDAGSGDVESEATDYLSALKKKHNKASDDTKYLGTVFGAVDNVGETQVLVEGGPEMSINEWISKRSNIHPVEDHIEVEAAELENGTSNPDGARSPSSSGLSSVGDNLDGEQLDGMDLTV